MQRWRWNKHSFKPQGREEKNYKSDFVFFVPTLRSLWLMDSEHRGNINKIVPEKLVG
jgi:hypothetical protein